jgi:hypothetical protein
LVDELLAEDLRELDALGKGPLLERLRQAAKAPAPHFWFPSAS